MNKYDDDFKLKVVEYSANHGTEATARHFGVASITVNTWRNILGETRYPERVAEFRPKKLPKTICRAVNADWQNGMTQSMLCKKYNTSIWRIKQCIRKRKRGVIEKPEFFNLPVEPDPTIVVPEVQTIEYDAPVVEEEKFVLTASELKKFTQMMRAIKDE